MKRARLLVFLGLVCSFIGATLFVIAATVGTECSGGNAALASPSTESREVDGAARNDAARTALTSGASTDGTRDGHSRSGRARASNEDASARASAPAPVRDPPPPLAPSSATETAIAGAIRGFLVREGGPWSAETLPKPKTVMLDLVSTRDRTASRRGEIAAEPDGAGGLRVTFTFEDVPAGEYELTLSALGSLRWAPGSVRVRPPLEGVTFTRFDLDRKLPLAFDVRDDASSERIDAFQSRHLQLTLSTDNGVFLHTGPLDSNSFPLQSTFAWSLWADGYAPAFGDETAFVERGDKRVAEVRLARGWSTKVLVLARDPVAKPMRGAEILLDGKSAGFTDKDGMLIVRAASRPAKLDVRFDAWKPVSDPLGAYNGLRPEQRGQVTIVMLER